MSSTSTPILDKVLLTFGKPDIVKIKDPKRVDELIQEIVSGGPETLQVIVDFDYTLTRHHLNGERCHSTMAIFENSSRMPEDYRTKALASTAKYYPIEIDPKLTSEEKVPYMIEWWNETHGLMIDSNLKKSTIKEIVEESRAILRDRAKETLQILSRHMVPTLVFSAGNGYVLEAILRNNQAFFDNMRVVSNVMIFDENDKLCGYGEPLIHVYNKNESVLNHDLSDEFFRDLSKRGNALVLGDSLGDAKMGTGIENPGAILKIGFLNDKVEERLDTFMNNFDIVLVDDQSTDFINALLSPMLKK